MNIMVVDDNKFMVHFISAIAEKLGHKVVCTACNGVEARKTYWENQSKVDVVTMDITMPEMDGIDAVKCLIDINPKVYIIMVSAMGYEDMVKQAIKNGAQNFIVKPFNDLIFKKALDRVIHKK